MIPKHKHDYFEQSPHSSTGGHHDTTDNTLVLEVTPDAAHTEPHAYTYMATALSHIVHGNLERSLSNRRCQLWRSKTVWASITGILV